MHLVAALYCVGVASILLFWGRLGSVRPWLSILLMCCLFLGAWVIMGYNRSSDAARDDPQSQPGLVFVDAGGLVHGWPGIPDYGLSLDLQPLERPAFPTGHCQCRGTLGVEPLTQFRHGGERYGIYFLQSIFSVLAFSRLTSRFWRRDERAKWAAEWLSVATKGMIFLVAAAVLLRIAVYAVHSALGSFPFAADHPCILLAYSWPAHRH